MKHSPRSRLTSPARTSRKTAITEGDRALRKLLEGHQRYLAG